MKKVAKILFVCLGNICRSPAAEGTLIKVLKEEKLSEMCLVDSAGTSGYHDGEWPDSRMIHESSKRKIALPSRSRKITEEDIEQFDLILCMDKENFKNVMKLNAASTNQHKIKLFCDSRVNMKYSEVPDPYFGTTEDFNLVLDIVHDASLGLVSYLKSELLK